MKKLLCACAFSLAATTAYSGNYIEPKIEPIVVVEETVKSGGKDDWVVLVMTLVTFGAALAGN